MPILSLSYISPKCPCDSRQNSSCLAAEGDTELAGSLRATLKQELGPAVIEECPQTPMCGRLPSPDHSRAWRGAIGIGNGRRYRRASRHSTPGRSLAVTGRCLWRHSIVITWLERLREMVWNTIHKIVIEIITLEKYIANEGSNFTFTQELRNVSREM